jgi:hypothetical protein
MTQSGHSGRATKAPNDNNRWTLPIGGGIGRIFKIGHQAIIWYSHSFISGAAS